MLHGLIPILLVLVVLGFVVWVVEGAPFISATVKPFIRWAAIVVAGLVVLKLLLELFNVTL